MSAELISQAQRLETAINATIDGICSQEEFSTGLVCAVLARIIERVSYWSAQVHAEGGIPCVALGAVEWVGPPDTWIDDRDRWCPWCGSYYIAGHRADCQRQAALGVQSCAAQEFDAILAAQDCAEIIALRAEVERLRTRTFGGWVDTWEVKEETP